MDAKTQNKRSIFYKFFSLLSVVRGYNVLLIVIAQYLAAIFIFSPNQSLKSVLLDNNLFFVVIASACVIAAGYIINNFYDADKDKINRPLKAKIDAIVNQQTKLKNLFFSQFCKFFVRILSIVASCDVFCDLYFFNMVLFT